MQVISKADLATNATHYEYAPTSIGEQTLFGKVYTNAVYTVVVLLLPLLLLLVLNTRIIREIRHLNERHAVISYCRAGATACHVVKCNASPSTSTLGGGVTSTGGGGGRERVITGGGPDRDESMTKIMVVIVFVFLLCHTPDRILQVR